MLKIGDEFSICKTVGRGTFQPDYAKACLLRGLAGACHSHRADENYPGF